MGIPCFDLFTVDETRLGHLSQQPRDSRHARDAYQPMTVTKCCVGPCDEGKVLTIKNGGFNADLMGISSDFMGFHQISWNIIGSEI